MLVAYQVQVVDEAKTAKLRRRRRRTVVKRFTAPAYLVLPAPAIAANRPNGNITRRLLLDYLPVQGDFHLRVKVPFSGGGSNGGGGGEDEDDEDDEDDDAFAWRDIADDDDDAAIAPFRGVVAVQCVPAAHMNNTLAANTEAVETRLTPACNAASSELLAPASTSSEITEKVEEALEQMKKDGKKTLKKIGNGFKALGALFKMKPTGFTVE